MGLLELVAGLLLLLWIGGFAFHIAGGAIHLLLVLAAVIFVLRFFRSSTV